MLLADYIYSNSAEYQTCNSCHTNGCLNNTHLSSFSIIWVPISPTMQDVITHLIYNPT